MALLKLSTARNRMFKMISSADHLSLKTGAAPVVSISKDSGAFGAAAGVVSEIANGWYNVALTAADTNTKGDLAFYVTGTGADDDDFLDQVVTDLPGDSVASVVGNVGGSIVGSVASVTARVTANTDQLAGQAVALDVNNLLKVDIEDWTGSAVAAMVGGAPFVNTGGHGGTAQAGGVNTLTLAAGASAVDSEYVYAAVSIIAGAGAGQSRIITAYVGATKVATTQPGWVTQPDATSVYALHAAGRRSDTNGNMSVDVEDWNGTAVATPNISGIPKVDVVDWKGTGVAAATAGLPDVNVKNINNVAAATPGAAGGALIAGHNAATTFDAGLVVNQSALNTPALTLAGNGSGAGLQSTGGATGPGLKLVGGGTSGDGLDITTTAGDGISILPTAGSAVVGTANGTSKHGAVLTGGTAGTSDGLKCGAGTGGVDLRANITGALSGSVGSVTARVTANADQIAGVAAALDANNLLKVDVEDWKAAAAPANTGDAYARLGPPVGASISADIAGVPVATLGATVETNGAAITRSVRDTLKVCLAGFGGSRSGFGTAAPAIADTASLGKTRILGSVADGIGNATVTLDTTGG